MGAGQPFGSQFLPHAGARGPTGLSPAGMAGVMAPSGVSPVSMSPARAPGAGPLYGGQRMPQHAYPGPPPSQQLPRQGLKRAYSNEVSFCTGGNRGVLEPSSPAGADSPWPCRDTRHSSTSRAGSTLRPVPSMPPAPPSPPLHPPPTLATGCSRAWASTSPPRATLDPITRYRGQTAGTGQGGLGVCHPLVPAPGNIPPPAAG